MSKTEREKYLGICHFELTGELFTGDGFWSRTLSNWIKQGAPKQIFDGAFRGQFFQYNSLYWLTEIRSGLEFSRGKVRDLGSGIHVGDWGTVPIVPSYEPSIISEDERTATVINGAGQTIRMFKGRTGKMPMFLEYPVEDRATWKEFKKRLEPNTPERWPNDWSAYVKNVNNLGEQMPIVLQVGSFFGFLREWMGTEPLLYTFYDDPALVEDMMDTMLNFEIEMVNRITKDIRVDQATYWEDMCYRSGPMISPTMFRKFMMPRYKILNDLIKSKGIDIIFVDSDGNVNQLIPLWMETGINLIFPLEVAAGMDAVALRKKYGKDLIMYGNIDKRALIEGKDAIYKEVISKVPYLLEQGGYIPSVDHNVPPDVTFENYCYYINTLREVAGLPEITFS